jgi:hypothetical protein
MKVEPISRWKTGFSWIVANVFGIICVLAAAVWLNDTIWPKYDCPDLCLVDNPVQRMIVNGLCIGCFVGIAEWLAFRRLSPWWILASTLGWATGLGVAEFISAFMPDDRILRAISEAIAGTIIGLTEWIVLRRYFVSSYWWIFARALIASALGVTTWITPGLSWALLLFYPIWFVMFSSVTGIITGMPFLLLIRSFAPKMAPEPQAK